MIFFFFQCRIIVYFKNIDRLSDVQLMVIKLDRKGILLLVFFYIIIFLLVWVWWRSLAFSIRESTCSDCDQLCKKKGELLHHGSLLHSTNHTHTHLCCPSQSREYTSLHWPAQRRQWVCVFVREKGVDGPLRRGNVTRWPSFPGCPCTGDKMRAEMDYIHPELLLQPLYSYGMISHTH